MENNIILDTTSSNVRKLLEVTPKNIFGREIIEKLSTLQYLGNEVIGARYEIVELDKIRQKTREGLRKLKDGKGQKKTSIVVNDKVMLKLPTKFVIKQLEKEYNNSSNEIDKARELLKDKVDELKKYEGDKDLDALGFRLKPINNYSENIL
ncbi:Hypothetical protein SRAE_1000094800 [Strongyloides ratti]|uniref:Uncharacterized protein n=1 Tax=Strongyloides ratti TaxID=34506 RepID=A0A090MV69_STRRB|nr:Hypothetical protein SRAE_1000094800 [Strongyloides ratti]CEF62678.1 Hypothetical protein SRAE_1000094800 [Strongyloides ratti]